MNRYYLYTISQNTYKLLLRNRVFQLSFLIILGLIVFFHIMEQSDLGKYFLPGKFSLASFVPYMNAYLFTLLQIIPLLFLVPTIGEKEEKLDSMDAVYYRPESNAEYVWGVSFGFARAFLLMGCVSLILAIIIHLFVNEAPFDILLYLFYLLTLILPTFVFTFGLCLVIKCFVNHRLLSLTLLLLYFIITVFFIQDYRGGIFDPTGTTLPNAFSEIEGHPDIKRYLLQRLAWFLFGLGGIQLSIIGFKRLPNTPEKRMGRVLIGVVFFIMGVVLIGGGVVENNEKHSARWLYAETYGKYADIPRTTLVSQSINFKQQGDQMEVKCRLMIQNQTRKGIPEIILYLNPGLEVLSLRVNESDVFFARENQAIIIKQPIFPNDTMELHIEYKGKIDERVCYLDIPDEVVFDMGQTKHFTCRFGKRYAFLDNHFTLLTPEALWYPVTEPSVDIESSYKSKKNFTQYTLNVVVPEKKTVISQGRKEMKEDGVTFYNDYPLGGISLCIGEYETRSIVIDSVTFNLNIFRRTPSFFNAIDSCDNSSLEEEKKAIESRIMKKKYPFSRLTLVETPISFISYFRDDRTGSEFVQPELVFLPEKFVDQINMSVKFDGLMYYEPKIDLTEALGNVLVRMQNRTCQNSWINDLFIKNNITDFLTQMFQPVDNPHYAAPLFFGHEAFLYSDDFLAINAVCRFILDDNTYTRYDGIGSVKSTGMNAIEFLTNHSLRDALECRELSRDILREIFMMKSLELVNYFNYHGISTDDLKVFISNYMNEYAFQKVDFVRFDSDFQQKFGYDWASVLPSWYDSKKIPIYLIKDFRIKRAMSSDAFSSAAVLVQFVIFNDSDVDGIVNLESSDTPFNSGFMSGSIGNINDKPVNISYLIKAKTGKKVSLYFPKSLPYFKLNTNISGNIPNQVKAFDENVDRIEDYREYVLQVGKEEFQPRGNEIVVDNEDNGFRVMQSLFRFNLQDYFIKNSISRKKYENLYTYVLLNDEWKTLANNNAYGYVNRSAVVRTGGTGQSTVEWRTKLTKEGKYEILVCVPNFSSINIVGEYKRGVQEYTIILPDGENKKVSVETRNEQGWISLGYFDCTPGECKISLSDVGAKEQVVIGDAVKWVYVDDTEEKE